MIFYLKPQGYLKKECKLIAKNKLIHLLAGASLIGSFFSESYALTAFVCPQIINFQCVLPRVVNTAPTLSNIVQRSTCRLSSAGSLASAFNFVAPDSLSRQISLAPITRTNFIGINLVPNREYLLARGAGIAAPSLLLPGQYTAAYEFSYFGNVPGLTGKISYCLYSVRLNPRAFVGLFSANYTKGSDTNYEKALGNWIPKGGGLQCYGTVANPCVFTLGSPILHVESKPKRKFSH